MVVRLELPIPAKLRLPQGRFQNLHAMHWDSFRYIERRHLKPLKVLEEVFIYL